MRIGAVRKAELHTAGYRIENLNVAYGPEHHGMYRWINPKTDTFQDTEASYSRENAWLRADEDERHRGYTHS